MRVTLCSLICAGSLAIFAALAGTATAATAPSGPPTATGTGGAAATVETLATQAAIDTLRLGGNAVDAAVTAAAVLGVTEPFSCGIGGGGFLLLRTAGGAVTSIDHREKAPAHMQVDSFWENGAPLPFTPARYSGLSVGVPGTVAGWADALHRYGTISLAEALAPAIRIAREGFVIDATFFAQTQENVDFFDDVPASAGLFLDPDGTPKDVGTVFRNPDLARAYERIAHLGAKGFYRGAIADALVETVQRPPISPTANHVWRPGLMTTRDLRAYEAPERAPTLVSYRGSTSTEWARRRAAARPSARRSTSSRAIRSQPRRASASCTCSSKPRATRSPTGARTWATRTTSTSRCAGSSPTHSRRRDGR